MERSFDIQLQDLKKAGGNVRVLSSDEVVQFEASTKYKEVQSAWAEDQKAKGVPDVSATIGKVTSIMNDFLG